MFGFFNQTKIVFHLSPFFFGLRHNSLQVVNCSLTSLSYLKAKRSKLIINFYTRCQDRILLIFHKARKPQRNMLCFNPVGISHAMQANIFIKDILKIFKNNHFLTSDSGLTGSLVTFEINSASVSLCPYISID